MFKEFDPRPRMCVFDVREKYKEVMYVLANISLVPNMEFVYEGDLVAISDRDPDSISKFIAIVSELRDSGVKVLTGQSFFSTARGHIVKSEV